MSKEKYILVIADKTQEMEVALQYACARSKKTNRKIIIASFIEPLDVLTTQGVTEIMQNEAREEAEKNLQYAASIVKESTGFMPVLQIREGEIMKEMKSLIDEEKNIILPAMELARKKGIICEGPFPPDTIFLEHRKGRFDAVVALYHDQALIPLKLYGFDRAVNITLGLPIIRTSPDHGTAFDLAPHFKASPSSMIEATKTALQMARISVQLAGSDRA